MIITRFKKRGELEEIPEEQLAALNNDIAMQEAKIHSYL